MLFFHKNLMFRLKIVSANFTLTCLENVLKKVTLALQFEDTLNVSYPPCSNKFFWNSLYRYLSLTIKVNLCKYLYICFSLQTHNQKFFSAGEVLWSQGTLIKVSSKKHKKKRSRRENFGNFFPQLLLKLHFEWNIQKDGRNQGLFSKIRALFTIFKKGQGRPPPPSPHVVARLRYYSGIQPRSSVSLSRACIIHQLYRPFTRDVTVALLIQYSTTGVSLEISRLTAIWPLVGWWVQFMTVNSVTKCHVKISLIILGKHKDR